MDETNQIIVSYVHSGRDYYEFYKLMKDNTIYKFDALIYDYHDETSENRYYEVLDSLSSLDIDRYFIKKGLID